jgi:hypothetical protein
MDGRRNNTKKQLAVKWKEIYLFLDSKKVPSSKIRILIMSFFMTQNDVGFLFGHTRETITKKLNSIWFDLCYKSKVDFYLEMINLPLVKYPIVPKNLEMQVKLIRGDIDGVKAIEIIKDELETLTKVQAMSKAVFVLQAALTFSEEGYIFQ